MASSIVYAYDDCIMYTANGFLNMLSYTTGKKVTLTSGVVCRKAVDVGVIRHKVKYETIPAGFVRIGKWVYYYEDGRRDCRIELLSTRLIKSRLFQAVEF